MTKKEVIQEGKYGLYVDWNLEGKFENITTSTRGYKAITEIYKHIKNKEKKYERLQNKYKILANKLRTHMQKDFVYRNNEAKKNQKLKDINTTLINKIYELSNDDNLAEIDDFIKEVLKKGRTDEKV